MGAETLPEDQLLLGLEEAEQIEAADEEEKDQSAPAERQAHASKRRANRGALPPHLPRLEMVVDIDDHACPCCRNGPHRIGGDVSERLYIVPAVARHRGAPSQICLPRHEDVVVQAPAPARMSEGGLPTEANVAQVLVSKYADHLRLYRQAQIYARQASISIVPRSLTGSAAPLGSRLAWRQREPAYLHRLAAQPEYPGRLTAAVPSTKTKCRTAA